MHALHHHPGDLWRTGLLAGLAALAVLALIAPPDLGRGSGGSATSAGDFRAVPGPIPPPVWLAEPLAAPTLQPRR